MATRGKRPKRQPARKVSVTLVVDAISIERIVGIHEAVPSVIYQDVVFLISDLSPFSIAALEICLRDHPIGLTPPDDRRKHRVVTGLRTWQLLQTLTQRGLVSPSLIPAVIHKEAVTPERIAALSISEALLSAQLFSLPQESGSEQLPKLAALLGDSEYRQLYRGDIAFSVTPPITVPSNFDAERQKQRSAPASDPNTPRRSRGRPRTRPLPDPNVPKRGRGRPRKIDPAQAHPPPDEATETALGSKPDTKPAPD